MKDKLKTILSNAAGDIDQDRLKEYLAQALDKDAAHQLEAQMVDDPFLSDAAEGLQGIEDKSKIADVVFKLDQDLKARLEKQKSRKVKRRYKDTINPLVAVFLILLLLIIIYLFYQKLKTGSA